MQEYKILTDIASELYKIRNKTIEYSVSDGIAASLWPERKPFTSYTFKVSGPLETYTSKYYKFVLSSMHHSENAVAFAELCTLEVCFDTAWYINSIDHHRGRISLNNVNMDVLSICHDSTDNSAMIVLRDEVITEEWLFQLMTKFDIPFYEDVLVLNSIRTDLFKFPYNVSFCIRYSKEHLQNFLFKIKDFLHDQS
ncbi:hypothetical protein pEaSNUABM50_00046 [Erwinia phage pEa_SNUABM_50]|uniref:Uncharacterized protein n=4 Tax=Eneladusvirus BF TaxID=2560751 RepID=A0A7L8ZNM1_9CAUD|nr:hypothetical protein FDH34_gp048 [Serratia phage BF]QOI70986.1 hypothetical protein pEaSNUABM12_00048 [Erwinia phage pEa_SNUABM_12]QOI71531.1 hypothetical protein pEaSNUABM47_00047 [Erwinia phage pEa_SNUABM_47]QOI72070.1 hypothetical protein pEaSNUABM50_00046 [Erwinia phage pEa_SNUABM_50]QXO11195.1 hypothetical protein pEaSNUABM19_00049 [Erwinia phage pEa_SNUABM_19]QXO12294.1 hypothetical protein pEaSNUABM49_00048 [Erwinia phage pEa_SNUABM_49]